MDYIRDQHKNKNYPAIKSSSASCDEALMSSLLVHRISSSTSSSTAVEEDPTLLRLGGGDGNRDDCAGKSAIMSRILFFRCDVPVYVIV